jgi:phosphoglucosamine mutase
MSNLFGTDGIRGAANDGVLAVDELLRFSRAVTTWLDQQNKGCSVVIGRDPRLSGEMMEATLAGGFASVGCDVMVAGIVPTPAIALMVRESGADLGIMISASHNQFSDNGIKLFKSDGYKLTDEEEAEIEKIYSEPNSWKSLSGGSEIGRIQVDDQFGRSYSQFCTLSLPPHFSLEGMTVALDTSNGAMSDCAPDLLQTLGAEVHVIHNHPDGININASCGSQHTEKLAVLVREMEADVGIAFDGDGDRCIAVDEHGEELRGDQVLAICALALKRAGKLPADSLVVTVMSNVGLHAAMKAAGIQVNVCGVGDRNVMKEMKECGASLGGEDSGHVIFHDFHTTGDGLITALQLLRIMKEDDKPLSVLADCISIFPQVMLNVEVRNKPELSSLHALQDAVKKAEEQLGDRGRVLIRYSGTESLCRVMVEGEDKTLIDDLAADLAAVVKRETA